MTNFDITGKQFVAYLRDLFALTDTSSLETFDDIFVQPKNEGDSPAGCPSSMKGNVAKIRSTLKPVWHQMSQADRESILQELTPSLSGDQLRIVPFTNKLVAPETMTALLQEEELKNLQDRDRSLDERLALLIAARDEGRFENSEFRTLTEHEGAKTFASRLKGKPSCQGEGAYPSLLLARNSSDARLIQ